MDHIPPEDLVQSADSFNTVIAARLNGDRRSMSQCKKCDCVIKNESINKWKHWKFACSSRLLFKYNYPTKIGDSLNVVCLVCHNQYNTLTMEFMKCHRRSCKSDQLVPVKEKGNIPQTAQTTINAMSSGIVCSKSDLSEPAPEIPPQTQKEPEILVSVQTISEPIYQSNDVGNVAKTNNFTLTNQSNENENVCFICNSTENKSFKSMYTTVSGASKTVIFDFVWKFMGGRPSVRNETTDASCMNEVVCGECLDLINEYDTARADAIDLRCGLINKITETEKQIVKAQNENSKKNSFGEKSSENFQEKPSLTCGGATYTSRNDQGTLIDLCEDDE